MMITREALERARRQVAEAKKKRPANAPLSDDLKSIVVDTTRLKEKRDATTLLMELRYGRD